MKWPLWSRRYGPPWDWRASEASCGSAWILLAAASSGILSSWACTTAGAARLPCPGWTSIQPARAEPESTLTPACGAPAGCSTERGREDTREHGMLRDIPPPKKSLAESPEQLLHVPIAQPPPSARLSPRGDCNIASKPHSPAVKLLLRNPARHCKRLSPLLAVPAALLLLQGQAKAVLTLNIFDDGPNLKVNLVGSLSQLPAAATSGFCGADGALIGQFAGTSLNTATCGGPGASAADSVSLYSITGPAGFGGTGFLIADSVSGSSFWFAASDYSGDAIYDSKLGIVPSYVLGSPYFGEAVFNGQSLASQGFTTLGPVGTWTIDGTSESINVVIGPLVASVPGPLPLFGAAAAFGWSRKLRRRIGAASITPPQT